MTEDEIVGWHHRHNGHEFEQTLGDSGGQTSLACPVPGVTKIEKNKNNNNHNKLNKLEW